MLGNACGGKATRAADISCMDFGPSGIVRRSGRRDGRSLLTDQGLRFAEPNFARPGGEVRLWSLVS